MVQQATSLVLRLGAAQDDSLPKVFGSVGRQIANTREEISGLQDRQRRLNAELQRTEEGSDAYRELERQIQETEQGVTELTEKLDRQQRTWDRIGRAARIGQNVARAGVVATGAAVAGLLVQIDQVGESSARLLTIQRETNIGIDLLQRLQQGAAAVGEELGVEEFRELNVRLGEARATAAQAQIEIERSGESSAEQLRIVAEGAGTAAEALTLLGFDATRFQAADLPLLLDKLAETPRELRQFYGDEILGGGLAERLLPILELPPEQRAVLEQTATLSEEQAEAFAYARIEMMQLRQEFYIMAASAGSQLLPAFKNLLTTVTPLIQGFASWIEDNPRLLTTLIAVGGGLTLLTGLVWALNTALAVRAALSGPLGWAALGVAAAVGAGAVAGGAYLVSRGNARAEELQSDQNEQFRELPLAVGRGAQQGVESGLGLRDENLERTLQNILPTAECAGREAALEVLAAAEEDVAPTPVAALPTARPVDLSIPPTTEDLVRPALEVNTVSTTPSVLERPAFEPLTEVELRRVQNFSISDFPRPEVGPPGFQSAPPAPAPGVTVYQTNNIQTTEAAAEVDNELRDALLRNNVEN